MDPVCRYCAAASDSLFSYGTELLPLDERFRVGDGIYQYNFRGNALMEDYLAWKSTQPIADWEVKRRAYLARNGRTDHYSVPV